SIGFIERRWCHALAAHPHSFSRFRFCAVRDSLLAGVAVRGIAMARPRDERQKDLLKPALDQIINLGHPLVRLAGEIDWGFLDTRFGSVCTPGPGQPPLPSRLVAGLFILKHMHNLS